MILWSRRNWVVNSLRIDSFQQQLQETIQIQSVNDAAAVQVPARKLLQGTMPKKLPNIDLPTLISWNARVFRINFCPLSIILLFTHMCKNSFCFSLKGDAAALVKYMPITETNFAPAWNSLVIHYENQRILPCVHILSLSELPLVANSLFSEIKRVMDCVQQTLRLFQLMHKPLEEWTNALCFFSQQARF